MVLGLPVAEGDVEAEEVGGGGTMLNPPDREDVLRRSRNLRGCWSVLVPDVMYQQEAGGWHCPGEQDVLYLAVGYWVDRAPPSSADQRVLVFPLKSLQAGVY